MKTSRTRYSYSIREQHCIQKLQVPVAEVKKSLYENDKC